MTMIVAVGIHLVTSPIFHGAAALIGLFAPGWRLALGLAVLLGIVQGLVMTHERWDDASIAGIALSVAVIVVWTLIIVSLWRVVRLVALSLLPARRA